MFSLNFKKNPITTVVGFLLIAVGVLPFLLPGRVTPDEAEQLKGLLGTLGENLESIIEIGIGIVAIFAKDPAAKPQ